MCGKTEDRTASHIPFVFRKDVGGTDKFPDLGSNGSRSTGEKLYAGASTRQTIPGFKELIV